MGQADLTDTAAFGCGAGQRSVAMRARCCVMSMMCMLLRTLSGTVEQGGSCREQAGAYQITTIHDVFLRA